jgi:hypothetical protein
MYIFVLINICLAIDYVNKLIKTEDDKDLLCGYYKITDCTLNGINKFIDSQNPDRQIQIQLSILSIVFEKNLVFTQNPNNTEIVTPVIKPKISFMPYLGNTAIWYKSALDYINTTNALVEYNTYMYNRDFRDLVLQKNINPLFVNCEIVAENCGNGYFSNKLTNQTFARLSVESDFTQKINNNITVLYILKPKTIKNCDEYLNKLNITNVDVQNIKSFLLKVPPKAILSDWRDCPTKIVEKFPNVTISVDTDNLYNWKKFIDDYYQ